MARRPAQRPAIPPTGSTWPLPLLLVDTGTLLYRLTRVGRPDPAFFGRLRRYRFDAPFDDPKDPRSYGVCYLGTTLACCLLEVLDPKRQTTTAHRFVTGAQVEAYYAAIATVDRPLRLAYLADDGLARLGIDQRHTAGDDYDLSGEWSAAIHAHGDRVDGILYATRHHNNLYAVALFDRAQGAVTFNRWGDLGDRTVPDLWVETEAALTRFNIDIVHIL